MANGRPKYTPSQEHLDTAYLGAKKGLNEKEIAEAIGISYRTLTRNKDKFSLYIKKGRDESDDKNIEKVVSALLKKCVGYEYIETHTESVSGCESKLKTITKHVQPCITSIIFFLCNRDPDNWKRHDQNTLTTESLIDTLNKYADTVEKKDG